jgi:hypothetical protein
MEVVVTDRGTASALNAEQLKKKASEGLGIVGT